MLWVIRSCLYDKNTTVIAWLLLVSCWLLLTSCHELFYLMRCRRLRRGINLTDPLVREAHRFHDRLMYQCSGSHRTVLCSGSLLSSRHFLLFLVELFAFEQFENAREQAHFHLLEAQWVHFRLVGEVGPTATLLLLRIIGGCLLALAGLADELLEALQRVD